MAIYNRKDYYYKKAKDEGYRSRAAYKLKELNSRYSLIKAGDYVADLGCAPGGFLQVASELVGESGLVIGVDLVDVAMVGRNVYVIKGDFTDGGLIEEMLKLTGGRRFDVILSDMAPRTTGIHFRDAYLSYKLAEAAYLSARSLLVKGGNMLIKIFEGQEVKGFTEEMKKTFSYIYLSRPESTRKGSKEIYIIAKGYNCE